MKNYFKRLFGKDKKKEFVFTTRNIARMTGNGDRIDTEPNQLPSQDWSASTNSGLTAFYSTDSALQQSYGVISAAPGQPAEIKTKVDQRKAVEPKEVFEEIKKQTPEMDFSNLDEKIKVVTERINVLKEHLDESHLKDEHMTLFYLKNRKAYLKTKDKYPMNWAMTTRDAVNDLCKTYKLKVVALKQYYTLIPKDGIKEMDRYTKAYKAVTGDNPIYELVIKDADVKTEEGKKEDNKQRKKDRDPILLANSPFGNALFVCGVWDDEVEIVDEIIYGLK